MRLKGAGGEEDTRAALNTLYEALLTLCLTLASSIIEMVFEIC
jgi:isoleucyl-tRNA synthetase